MTEADGLSAMHEALAMGVGAVVPVTPQARAAVEEQFSAAHPEAMSLR